MYQFYSLELFNTCPRCANRTTGIIKHIRGSTLCVQQDCIQCKFRRVWYSRPMIGSIPAGNLAISCALLFLGSLPSKLMRFMYFMGLQTISYSAYMKHQVTFIKPTIPKVWNQKQQKYFNEARRIGEPLCIDGNGRCDSMGHSAKSGSYSVIDLESGIIIDVQLVQSNEVKSSLHMEKEELDRSVSFF